MKNSWWFRLVKCGLDQWSQLLIVVGLMLTAVALAALQPWPLKLLVDYVFTDAPLPEHFAWLEDLPGARADAGLCAWLAAGTLILFAAAWCMQTLQAYVQSGVAIRMTYGLGARILEHLQRLSLRYHSRQPTGDLVRRVTRDSRCARDLVLEVVAPAVTAAASLLVMFVIMWQLDVQLTIVALLVVPAIAWAQWRFYRPMVERTYDQQQCEGEMISHAEQTLTALPVVQAYRREPQEEQRFREIAQRTLKAYFRALAAQLRFRLSINSATAVGRASILVVGGYLVWNGSLTIGSLLVFLAYLESLYTPLDSLSQLSSSLATTEACATRVFEVLDHEDFLPPVWAAEVGDLPLPREFSGRIRFESVHFAYVADHPVLRDIDLEIQPGRTVAIVGHTGAGKSTLASLLMRFFDPTGGRITLDGIDLRRIAVPRLRRQLSILLQEPFLLPVSIAENVAYGRPDASLGQIIAAAETANAREFIERLPDGFQTRLGERGVTLSGGERQRIAIARALLKDAPILILDEPTSALDARTESSLISALQRLMAGRTTLVIAHRMSTIRQADQIVVLEEGRIVDVGRHEELLDRGGAYEAMVRNHHASDRSPKLNFATNTATGHD